MAEPRIVEGVEGLTSLVGEHVGYSDWIEITQDQVDRFADATGDDQWIHVDPARAASGPFGGTIAHGFLTLSLIPLVLPQVLDVRGFSMGVNYGMDKVRFPSPVLVGSRVRAGVAVEEVTEVGAGVQTSLSITFEVEGAEKPACVARFLERRYP
ncbi:MaoC family dehydratase [Nitriliruptor alkaliphilus]|uniref:MaoC family dehydratase n=1 Tax=Nitriliruptor alkaliphilus TaxID=427918 RepID=UPI00069835CF|nr:MaoC family dehydratase [Nitriliruptor alkaliphilus]